MVKTFTSAYTQRTLARFWHKNLTGLVPRSSVVLGAQCSLSNRHCIRFAGKPILRPAPRERAHNPGTERRSGLGLDNKLDDHPNEGISDQEAHPSMRLHPPTRDDLDITLVSCVLRLAGSDSNASETRTVRISTIDAQVISTAAPPADVNGTMGRCLSQHSPAIRPIFCPIQRIWIGIRAPNGLIRRSLPAFVVFLLPNPSLRACTGTAPNPGSGTRHHAKS